MINKVVFASLLGAGTVAGAGWGAHDYLHETFSRKEPVQIVGAKTDFIIDRQIAAIAAEIGYLERKPNKTQADIEQLRWLREQLEQVRRVRSGR